MDETADTVMHSATETPTAQLTVETLARQYVASLDPLGKPYFQALAQAGFPLERFLRQQGQFSFAVIHFARPLALLAGRLVDPELRDLIVRNVWEEHGQGDRNRWHRTTFHQFLRRLGMPAETLAGLEPGVAVDAFNTGLDGLCTTEAPATAAATLGTIELMFSTISAFHARTILAQGWLYEADLAHYNLHAELDVDHARDLFAVAAAGATVDAWRGIRLGAYLFERLYDDLAKL